MAELYQIENLLDSIECEYCNINFSITDYLQHACYTDWFCGICNVYHVKDYICNAFDSNEFCSSCKSISCGEFCQNFDYAKQKVLKIDIGTQTTEV